MEENREMYFFFGRQNPLSNWYMRDFVFRGITFCCNEQFMMYCKAKLFGDHEIAEKILATRDPAEHKRLGRQVRKFDGKIWAEKRQYYVFVGARAKFEQNPDLAEFLLATDDKELVEAAKHDTIWGVGLDADSPAIRHKRLWRGLNLLGITLEQVRAVLRESIKVHKEI